MDRRSWRGPRHPAPVAADAARAGPPVGEGPRHPGPDLLQGRIRVARRVAQAEHRHPAGVLQQGRRHPQAGDRDRRGAVGQRPQLRRRPLRSRVSRLHGPGVLRAEALSAGDDGDLGWLGRSLAGRRPLPPRLSRHRHQRCRPRRRRAGRHPLRPRFGPQPRPAAPDRDRPRGQGAAGPGRREPARHRHRLLRGRFELRWSVAAVRARRRCRPAGGRALVVPHPHVGQLRVRLRRHRRA